MSVQNAPKKPSQFHQSLSVVTWNIASLPKWVTNIHKKTFTDYTPKERAEWVVTTIREQYYMMDVVMLNEVFTVACCWGYAQYIIDALQPLFPYAASLGGRSLLFDSGLVTLSKHPFVDVQRHFYRERRGWDRFTAKGFLDVVIRCPFAKEGGLVHCINTHMQQGNRAVENRARLSQVKECIVYMNGLSADDAIVFGGDLNMAPKDDRAQAFSYLKNHSPCVVVTKDFYYLLIHFFARFQRQHRYRVRKYPFDRKVSDSDPVSIMIDYA